MQGARLTDAGQLSAEKHVDDPPAFADFEMAGVTEQALSEKIELALVLVRSSNVNVKLSSLTPRRYNLAQASVCSLVAAIG